MLSITHHLARRLEMAEAEDGVACVEAQRLLAAVSVARALGAGWQPEGKLAQLAQAPKQ